MELLSLGIALAVGFAAGWILSSRRSIAEMARFEGRVEELQGQLIRARRANDALLAEAACDTGASSAGAHAASGDLGRPQADVQPDDALEAGLEGNADQTPDNDLDDEGDEYVEVDELTRIRGIGKVLEEKLYDLGVFTYERIAALTPEEIQHIDRELRLRGRIKRNDWIGQARRLMEEEEGRPPEAQSRLL